MFDYLVKQVRRTELIDALQRVLKYLDGKNAVPDWNTYFALFSEEAPLTVADCCRMLNMPPYASCCVLTRMHDVDLDTPMISAPLCRPGLSRISLRTGARKETVLFCYDVPPANEPLPPGVLQGSSGAGDPGESFCALQRRSEIALLTALSRNECQCVYRADSPDALSGALTAFSLALRSGDQSALLARLEEIHCGCMSLQFDVVLTIINRLILQLQDSRTGAWKTLEPRHELFSGSASLEELFEPLVRCITAEPSSQTIAPSQIQQILDALDDMYTQEIRIADLASRFFISANYLSILIKLFKKHIGVTPHAYRQASRKGK